MKTNDGIYVVFPDYEVNTESFLGKMPLGHGMAIAYDPKTGQTRGSEYGRYDKLNKGVARRVKVPDFTLKPGMSLQENLDNYARELDRAYGHSGGRTQVYYIPGADYNEMVQMMESAESGDREKGYYVNSDYRILDHNCGTYAADMIKASLPWYDYGGFSLYTMGTPSMVAPSSLLFGEYSQTSQQTPATSAQQAQRRKARPKRHGQGGTIDFLLSPENISRIKALIQRNNISI